jgi:hypothetical protein
VDDILTNRQHNSHFSENVSVELAWDTSKYIYIYIFLVHVYKFGSTKPLKRIGSKAIKEST